MVKVPKHINNTLPPVDLYVYFFIKEYDEYVRAKRITWATSNHPNYIEVFEENNTKHLIPMGELQWFYP